LGKGSLEVDRRREDEMMGNESKGHRRDANVYSVECRAGDESGCCGDLSRPRSYKSKGLIVNTSGWASFIGRPSEH
jgi:hypothetical protein